MFWCFLFFKMKTAYEMRISDWSSDVCSSDLRHQDRVVVADRHLMRLAQESAGFRQTDGVTFRILLGFISRRRHSDASPASAEPSTFSRKASMFGQEIGRAHV